MTAPQETFLHPLGAICVTLLRRISRKSRLQTVFATLLSAALLLGATGCALNKPASSAFASVEISGHSPQQIQEAAGNVFREDGYSAFLANDGQMIFQKEGSRANNISQNGIVGSHYGETTLFRFVAQLVQLNSDTFRLQGQAYLVRNPGDSMMEDSHPLALVRRGPYQRLLNKVERAVKKMPPPTAPAPAAAPSGQ